VQQAAKTQVTAADDLTPRQVDFIKAYMANGGNATRAFLAACDDGKGSRGAAKVMAHRLLRVPAVAAKIAELRRIAGEALSSSVGELAQQLFEVATTPAADLMPVETHACRVCASADGVTPGWESIEEYSDAVDAWKASLDTPKPRPEPSLKGGCTYERFGLVNPSCKGCGGRGIASVRIVPTDDMTAGARMLYAGAVLRDDGTVERLLFEDRTKYRDQLHKLLGLYVAKSENKNLNVNYNLATPTTAQAPLSADDALAKLRAIGMLSPDDDSVVSEQ
jgi:hypothetical protein